MKKNKKLSTKWIITYIILAIALVALIYILAFKVPQMKQYNKTIDARSTSESNAEFLANSTVKSDDDDAPYLETGIDGIYYTANYDGKISFYKFVNGSFDSISTSDTCTVSFPNTKEDTSTKISFITINDQTVGFGVYSNRSSTDFPYALIRVIPNKITENYDYVAFVDYTYADYYSNSKTYESICVFSEKESTLTEVFSSDDADIFIPVELVEKSNSFYYFLKNEDSTYSLYVKTTVFGKEYPVSETLALPYALYKDNSLYIFDTTKMEGLAEDTTFYLVESGAIEPTPIKEFSGDISSYLVKDNYIFDPTTKIIYDVESGTEQKINIADNFTSIEDFDITDGGAKIAIAGTIDDDEDMLLLYEFATDKSKLIGGDNLFLKGNPNINATDEYIMFLSPAKTSDYVVNIVIPWDKIF